jgi:tetratricopeptide (TPR) repeat protein
MARLVRRSVTQLLRGGSRVRPVVIVMDDLHWADLSSIELLEGLLRLCEDHPIFFFLLFRPGFESSERVRQRARADHGGRYVEIELRPLDGSAVRAMLNNLFRQGDLPHATRQTIEERARGNPFYIEEVVRTLVDEGAVEVRKGRFRATEKIHGVVIPGTIQEVVMARIDGLPLRRKQVLQTACVIGGTFHRAVLAEVVGDGAGLTDELQELLDAEFLVPSDRLPGEEYAFKHPLIQEVAYEGLLHARREELHRAVGEAAERVLPPDLPGYSGMLAYHYGRCRDAARAEEFLLRAGDDAARAAASSEALHFFEEASKSYLELHGGAGDPKTRALLEKSVARALYFRGRFVEAIDHFDRALELLGDRVSKGRVRSSLRFAANLGAVLARLYGPRFSRSRASLPSEREIFELRYARAEATVTALPTRHLFDSMDGLALLQRVDPATVPRSGMFYAGCSALFAFGGISFDVSRRLAAKAHALVSAGDPDEYLYERAMSFTGRVLEGDWRDEHEIEPARIEESVRRGQLWGPTTYLGLLAEKRIHQGRFDDARSAVGQIDEIWDLFQYDLAKTNHYYLRTLLALERHELPEAVEAADAYYDENPEDLLHILALGAKAKALTLLGRLDAAEEALSLSSEVVARSSPVPPFHASSFHRSHLLFDLARLEAAPRGQVQQHWRKSAHRSARAALRSAGRVAWRRTEVLRLVGRLHGLDGDGRRALRWLEKSVAAGEALGARPEIARTYAEVSRQLRNPACGQTRFRGLDADGCLGRERAELGALGLGTDREGVDVA